jgi:hypothetical protein
VVPPRGTTTVAGEPSTERVTEVVVISVPVVPDSFELAMTDTVYVTDGSGPSGPLPVTIMVHNPGVPNGTPSLMGSLAAPTPSSGTFRVTLAVLLVGGLNCTVKSVSPVDGE